MKPTLWRAVLLYLLSLNYIWNEIVVLEPLILNPNVFQFNINVRVSVKWLTLCCKSRPISYNT